jgi:hypothetical protein
MDVIRKTKKALGSILLRFRDRFRVPWSKHPITGSIRRQYGSPQITALCKIDAISPLHYKRKPSAGEGPRSVGKISGDGVPVELPVRPCCGKNQDGYYRKDSEDVERETFHRHGMAERVQRWGRFGRGRRFAFLLALSRLRSRFV